VELAADRRPRVIHQFFGDDRDLETSIAAAKLIERIYKMPSLAGLVIGDRTPNPVPTTDDGWAAFIRAKSGAAFHPVGTCRMGSGVDAVVDPQLRVHGLAGLRVADASVMPRVTSANTNATCIMIGEKLSGMIRGT
jgi:choline dehydrogenase